jgi:hypothetical protein
MLPSGPSHPLFFRACFRPTVAFLMLAWPCLIGETHAADAQASLQLAPLGTPFFFEVIDSHDAKYPGDTPAHMGKDGGLTVRPNVALGDPVYKTVSNASNKAPNNAANPTSNQAATVVGKITLVRWDRVSGSLTVEFFPEPFQRIAVGDEVWIDLNPAPAKPATPGPPAP